MEISLFTKILLGILAVSLLVGPLVSKWVENHLEVFLLCVGAAAVSVVHLWSHSFIYQTLNAPVNVAFIVLVVSIIFNYYSRYIFRILFILFKCFEPCYSFAILVLLLGFTSSIFSVTVAALILAEVLQVVNLERDQTIKVTVYACYAIGMGAILLPLAEPLGLVIYNQLAQSAYKADFFFIFRHFFGWIAPGIALMALAAGYTVRHANTQVQLHICEDKEDYKSMLRRTWHVYLFVAALHLISAGLRPFAQSTISHLSGKILFWANASSVIIDNATLAAIEVTPSVTLDNLMYMIIGLAAFGSMLVQGNLPNIVAAEKLGIKSREWARIAVPAGLVLTGGYFIALWCVR